MGVSRTVFILLVQLAALPLFGAVEGTVVTNRNIPVEGARVELADGSAFRMTDGRGAFRFADVDAPVALRVTHPRFQPLEAECCVAGAATLTVVPKHEVYSEIVVTANREGSDAIEPVSVATSSVSPVDRPAPAASVVELAEGMPSVAENGQGGLFQAYSIRGTGGQRVQTLVAGARIVTERRAGATASFIDPRLLGSVEVVRGPYSSYYGSGALGGVLEAVPRRFSETTFSAAWETEGDANSQTVGLDLGGWSLGLARQSSNGTETPDGLYLPSQYEQYSATVGKLWTLSSGLELDLLLVPTLGKDIGKPNQRYPSRITTYPEERHLVGRLSFRRPGVWHLDLYGHPNSLDSENLRSTSHSLVENEAFDFGLNYQRELTLPASFAARVGLDYFGRRGVQATEHIDDYETGTSETVTTLDGRQDEIGVYASFRRSFGIVSAEVGGRFAWIEQGNVGAATTDDSAPTGFAGLTAKVGGGFELVGNVGTGFRFPGLSERYYTGSTGRGEIIANEDLEPERSLNVDVGVRYFGSRFYAAAYVYRMEIDDYIEQIELEDGVQTFVNLTSGRIAGFELEGFYDVTDHLTLRLAGQTTNGEASDGSPLSESPPDRVTIGGSYTQRAWAGDLRWEHRFAKNDPGPGEVATDAADVVSASVGYTLRNGLTLQVFGRNLLNETYLPSPDDLAVPAARRSVGLGIHWAG